MPIMRFSNQPDKKLKASMVLYGLEDNTPEEESFRTTRWLFILLLAVLIAAAYYYLIINKVLVELELETDTRTVLKFYWPDKNGQFSERRMAQLLIKPDKTQYKIRVCNISGIDFLRIDPSEKTAYVTIKKLALQQSGYPPYILKSSADFGNLQVISGVESLVRQEKGGVKVQVKSRDPQLRLLLPPTRHRTLGLYDFGCMFLVMLLAMIGYIVFSSFFKRSDFIPVLSAIVLALILVMAGISQFNAHPDEIVHVAAGKYYENHNLPPQVGSAVAEHTYSVYGVSRLHSGEIVYLLAGKFLQFLRPLHLEPFLALRLFNVLMFTCLVLYAYNKLDFRFFLLPILISPQIWYVFSYFNSDAFATFIGLISAYQLAADKSAFNTMLQGNESKGSWSTLLLLGILFGLLLLLKKNFYFLYMFFFLYFIWRLWVAGPVWSKKTVLCFSTVVLIGCSVFMVYRGVDAWVNDFDKTALMLEAREKYASDMFKPSTPLSQKHAYLQIRERGTTLKHFLEVDRWGEKSFRTAFGVYGYTSIPAPFSYYEYVRVVGLLLLLTLIVSVVWRGHFAGITLLAISLGAALFLIVVAIYHAWTVDFQAQGRYLLPIVPMMAILLYHCQRILIRPLFFSLFLMIFLLSVYNFIFVGLHDIGKCGT